MNMKRIIGMLMLLIGAPSLAQAEPLMAGISDQWLLIYILAGGVIMLFACIIALTYMLYKSIPLLVEKQQKR